MELFKNPAKKTYRKILKKWTRNREEYQRDDFYSSLTWYATLQSPEMIEAKSDYMSQIYAFKQEKRDELFLAEQKKFSQYTAVYLSLYSYDFKYSDITRKDAYWKLYLDVGDVRYEPVKIEKIEKLTPLYQTLYPYSDIWSRYFYVYFPKVDYAHQQIKLIIAGPTSRSELIWE